LQHTESADSKRKGVKIVVYRFKDYLNEYSIIQQRSVGRGRRKLTDLNEFALVGLWDGWKRKYLTACKQRGAVPNLKGLSLMTREWTIPRSGDVLARNSVRMYLLRGFCSAVEQGVI
jgi:hypothetical protein